MGMDKIAIIEQKGAFRLLLYLLENKTAFFTEIESSIERLGQSATYSAIRKLLGLKLIEESREPPYNKRVFKLTTKGKKVALLLAEIEKILQED